MREQQLEKMEERLEYLYASDRISMDEYLIYRSALSQILEDEIQRCKERVIKRVGKNE